MNTVDALKRLQRAGSDNSKVTEKLKDACRLVAGELFRNAHQASKGVLR